MPEMNYRTETTRLQADTYTPVSICLKLRDAFYNTLLLESSDYHTAENSYSFICCDPLASFKVENDLAVIQFYQSKQKKIPLASNDLFREFENFTSSFKENNHSTTIANGLFGYVGFNAVRRFDKFSLNGIDNEVPELWFTFFRFVIAFNHFKDELVLYENIPEGEASRKEKVLSLIRNKNVPQYPFKTESKEDSLTSDEGFLETVRNGIRHCYRGDVFQIVLSRRFTRKYTGDDMNVYRALRSINPSPYLFYFDYGNFHLFGSSPEAQLVVKDNTVTINPIAGTFRRTGDDKLDKELAERLSADPKENAEHVMLVDLARNDLSKHAEYVTVEHYKQIHFYSHVIHLVSEVTGKIRKPFNPLQLIADTFPAGTLSGAPKHKAIELITKYESHSRGFYGGCIGFIGFNGDINTAITIRTFMSKENKLHYQAGAGVVAASVPESELEEVNNKLKALRDAIAMAESI